MVTSTTNTKQFNLNLMIFLSKREGGIVNLDISYDIQNDTGTRYNGDNSDIFLKLKTKYMI